MAGEFADAFTSILKFRGQQEELLRARLEREEWQTRAGYRQRMADLDEQKAAADLQNSMTNRDLMQSQTALNQNALSEALTTQPERIGRLRADREHEEALTEETRTRTVGARMDIANKSGQSLGAKAQLSGTEFGLNDAGALADNLMETLGVKNTPANKAVYLNQVYSEALATQKEIAQLRSKNDFDRQVNETNLAMELSKMSMQTMDPHASLEAILPSYADNPGVVSKARGFVKDAMSTMDKLERQTRIKMAQGYKDKYTDDVGEQLSVIQTQIAKIESGRKTKEGTYGRSGDEKLRELKEQKASLQRGLGNYLNEKFGISDEKASSVPALSAEQLSELPSWIGDATDEELSVLSKAKSIPLDALKLERDRRLKRRGK